jgi:hypothetical protein
MLLNPQVRGLITLDATGNANYDTEETIPACVLFRIRKHRRSAYTPVLAKYSNPNRFHFSYGRLTGQS